MSPFKDPVTIEVPAKTTEKLDLSAFEFNVPCDITTARKKEPCASPAEWWAEFTPHCAGPEQTFEMFLCAKHHAHIVEGGPGRCYDCGKGLVLKDHLLRTERIKP